MTSYHREDCRTDNGQSSRDWNLDEFRRAAYDVARAVRRLDELGHRPGWMPTAQRTPVWRDLTDARDRLNTILGQHPA